MRHLIVIDVGRFPSLVVDVGVLGRAPDGRVGRVHGPAAKICNGVIIDDFLDVLVVDDLNFLQLVGSAEAIEKMQKRNTRFDLPHPALKRTYINLYKT